MTDTERRLAAALHEEACRINPGHLDWTNCADDGPCADDAAALLPVVAEIEVEARAGALREAAEEMDRHDVVTIEDTDIGSNLIPVSPADRLRRMADEMKEQG